MVLPENPSGEKAHPMPKGCRAPALSTPKPEPLEDVSAGVNVRSAIYPTSFACAKASRLSPV